MKLYHRALSLRQHNVRMPGTHGYGWPGTVPPPWDEEAQLVLAQQDR